MNVNKDLVIINNEKISKEKTNFYCDNIDVKSIPEDLDKKFSVTLIARNSKDQRMTNKYRKNSIGYKYICLFI